MYHVRFTRICNRGLFLHIFAAYFAITWSAYFEKNFRVFLICLTDQIQHVRGRNHIFDISDNLDSMSGLIVLQPKDGSYHLRLHPDDPVVHDIIV